MWSRLAVRTTTSASLRLSTGLPGWIDVARASKTGFVASKLLRVGVRIYLPPARTQLSAMKS